MKDYYEILEVHRKASTEVIRKAYRVLAAKYHPDTSKLGKEDATKRMSELNEAYAILSDEKKRREYDLQFNKSYSHSNTNYSQQNDTKQDSEKTTYSTNTYSMTIELAKERFFNCCEKYTFAVKNRRIADKTDSWANIASCRQLQNEFFSSIREEYNMLLQANQLNGHLAHIYMVALLSFCDEFIKWNGHSDADKILKIAYNHKDCDDDIRKRYAAISYNVSQHNIDRSRNREVKFEENSKKRNSSMQSCSSITKTVLFLFLGLTVFVAGLYFIETFQRNKSRSSKQTYTYEELDRLAKGASGQKKYEINFNDLDKALNKSKVVTGYDKAHGFYNASGNCELTIDNSQNEDDIYLRVWDISGVPKAVRAIYIKGKQSFTMYKLNAGKYELRYKTLPTKGRSYATKSQSFVMEDNNKGYSVMKITLYKVRNGNFHTYGIDINDI